MRETKIDPTPYMKDPGDPRTVHHKSTKTMEVDEKTYNMNWDRIFNDLDKKDSK